MDAQIKYFTNTWFERSHLRLYLFIFICINSFILYVGLTHELKDKTFSEEPRQSYPGPVQDISGFHYASNHEGNCRLTIKADRFMIKRSKVGFLSFGLLNEAVFENASFNFYGIPKYDDKLSDTIKGNVSNVWKYFSVEKTGKNILQFNTIDLDELAPAISTRRISSVRVKSITIAYWYRETELSRISADSAAFDGSGDGILFTGDVVMRSGDRCLKTEQLQLLPESTTVRIDRHFLLKSNERTSEGNQLVSDIFLSGI